MGHRWWQEGRKGWEGHGGAQSIRPGLIGRGVAEGARLARAWQGRARGRGRPGGRGAGAGAGAGGAAPVTVASLPGAPGRRGSRLFAALPTGRLRVGERGSAQPGPRPSARAVRASPCGHGGVRAPTARSDHGGAGLGQGHRVVAHHPTIRAEAPLERGPAPRQHASGHRWEHAEGWPGAVSRGRNAGGEAGAADAGPRMRVPGVGRSICLRRPGRDPGLLSYCSPKPLAWWTASGGLLGEITRKLGQVGSSKIKGHHLALERHVRPQSQVPLRVHRAPAYSPRALEPGELCARSLFTFFFFLNSIGFSGSDLSPISEGRILFTLVAGTKLA